MPYYVTITDCDHAIEYEVAVYGRVTPDRGKPYGIDIDRVELLRCTVWLAKCGMEVKLDPQHVAAWERELEREYGEQIAEQMIEQYENARDERDVA